MEEIKAKEEFSLNGIIYTKGDNVKITKVEDLIKLNEKGFIEPLTAKDLQNFANNLNSKKYEFKNIKEKEE